MASQLRTFAIAYLLGLVSATSANAQVQVEVRTEKPQYLAAEPVVVLVDVRNVGDEAVGYSKCDGRVRLEVVGVQRRVLPNIHGCFSGIGTGISSCGIDHPPMLKPGDTTRFRYVLKDYDLAPGQYRLSVSGTAGVRAADAQFASTAHLTIVASSVENLRTAVAPLVAAANGGDWQERRDAREAIIESALPFLAPDIGLFALEDTFDASAIEALGRIASEDSRSTLKLLFRMRGEPHRQSIALALARIGHPEDAKFLADVLQNGTVDARSRYYAALGLGRIGGDSAVQLLTRSIEAASRDVRPGIAKALGNTRSRAALPVLIEMWPDDSAHNDICIALRTLTHQTWCDGSDPAETKKEWQRRWTETGPKLPIFGPDNCPSLGVPAPIATHRPARR